MIFVVDGVEGGFLGRPTIQALDVLPRLHDIYMGEAFGPNVPRQYVSLIQGNLGKMKTEYTIALHPDAKAFAITYPQWVPIQLLPAVHPELERMEGLGVLQRVDHATQWCTSLVVARKNDSLHDCFDYAELNNQINCKKVIMPTVEENLAKLVGT